jgi:AcrR family transcriptional regulator
MDKMASPPAKNNRDALLDGALRCLQDRGYARTTARDIVAASGTNLGAIGYHYGSTEELLNQAVVEGFRRWFDELADSAVRSGGDTPLERLTRITAEFPDSFERNRPVARAFVEALAQAEHSEDVRVALADTYEEGRQNLIALLQPALGDPDSVQARVLASLLIAIFDGGLMQWLVDPDRTPTGADVLKVLPWTSA